MLRLFRGGGLFRNGGLFRSGGPPVRAALLLATAATVATLATLAACSAGSHPTAGPGPTATGSADILAIGREAARCMREHGVPDFPDPVVDSDGHLQLPSGPEGDRAKQALNNNPAAQAACEPILDRLPPNAVPNKGTVTGQDLASLMKFAQCVRHNGIPEWPDPRSDGSFPLSGTPLAAEGKSPRLRAAMQACKQYWDKGITGS
jgi:hypothetical protein